MSWNLTKRRLNRSRFDAVEMRTDVILVAAAAGNAATNAAILFLRCPRRDESHSKLIRCNNIGRGYT